MTFYIGKEKVVLLEANNRTEFVIKKLQVDSLYEVMAILDDNYKTWRNGDKNIIPICSYEKGILLYKEKKIDKFVICSHTEPYITARLVARLQRQGIPIEKILYVEEQNFINLHLEECICCVPYMMRRDLDYLEFQIVDHCNLKCESCLHYSPLVKGKIFSKYNELFEGLSKMSLYYRTVKNIRIMGGEPLLNDDISRYVTAVRLFYPDSNIYIVTNAVLILELKDEVLDTIRENGAIIDISYYPVMVGKMEEIHFYLEEKRISHRISRMIRTFRKVGKLKESSIEEMESTFRKCPSRMSTCLNGTKIAPCFLPFVTHYFNDYYQLALPENDYLDLNEEGLTTMKINEYLEQPLERCRYCSSSWMGDEVEWKRADNIRKIDISAFIYK